MLIINLTIPDSVEFGCAHHPATGKMCFKTEMCLGSLG